jgi:hypothetical protein
MDGNRWDDNHRLHPIRNAKRIIPASKNDLTKNKRMSSHLGVLFALEVGNRVGNGFFRYKKRG